MPEVLYNSAKIREKISYLFDKPEGAGRRVVLVAYIGKDYAQYLRSPKGIEIICSPTAGATSVAAIDGLQKAGAWVRFSDELHMKVYWSETRGSVITSANLSDNALGIKGLKEAGVWLEASTLDIDDLVREAQPYEVKETRLDRLRRDEERYKRAMAKIGRREADDGFQFLDWSSLSAVARTPWKIGDYIGEDIIAPTAKERLKDEFNQTEEANYLSVKSQDLLSEGDWILQFEYDYEKKRMTGSPEWMMVDFVAAFDKKRAYPFQAIQVHPNGNYERPPFRLTPQFKKAFRSAIATLDGLSVASGSMLPADVLLQTIAEQMVSKERQESEQNSGAAET